MLKKVVGKMLMAALVAIAALSIVPAAKAAETDWVFRTRAIAVIPESGRSGPADLEVKSDLAFDIDLTRFLTRNLALELTALVSSHEVDSALGSLGSVRVLPPTLTLQYHFLPEGKIRPYVGGGFSYVIFYDETGLLDQLDVKLDDGFHWALQAGADVMLNETFSLNLDLKYVDLDTDVDSNLGDLGNLEINPWIVGVGLGYRF